MHEHGQHRGVARGFDAVHLGAGHADHDGVDGLEVRRVGGQFDVEGVARRTGEGAGLSEVVLDVAGALDGLGIDVALELGEELLVLLADDVDEHVETTAMRHAEHGGVHGGVGGGAEHGVEQGDGRFGALDAESLLAEVLGAEELLERLGGVESIEDVALLLDAEFDGDALDLLLDPALLDRVLDVHVLDADGAAVGVAQHVEDLVELHVLATGDAAGEEDTIEVPDAEAVRRRIELGMQIGLLGLERIEIRDEVTAHAMHVDECLHAHLLLEHRLLASEGVGVAAPFDGLIGHAERAEDVLVELVLAHQQFVHALEEQPRLGTLDDAVVVGGGDGHDLGEAETGERGGIGALVGSRIVERTDADDESLARHEARHRLHGADGAGVGEADGHAGEVVGGELVGADLADDLLVGLEEAGEVEGVGGLDARHQQRAGPVGLLLIDREAEIEVLVTDHVRLAVGALGVRRVHHRRGFGDGPHDGVADDVGEAHLAAAAATQERVDGLAVDLEQLGRDLTEAGGSGHAEAGFHVGHDASGGTAQGCALWGGRRGGCGRGARCCRGRRRGGGRSRRYGRDRRRSGRGVGPVAMEELAPALAHRVGVDLVLLEHFIDEPRIRARDLGGGVVSHER